MHIYRVKHLCLFYNYYIHIRLLVINTVDADTWIDRQTDRHTHITDVQTKAISRSFARTSCRLVYALFKNQVLTSLMAGQQANSLSDKMQVNTMFYISLQIKMIAIFKVMPEGTYIVLF